MLLVFTDNEGLVRDARKWQLFSLVHMLQDHESPLDMSLVRYRADLQLMKARNAIFSKKAIAALLADRDDHFKDPQLVIFAILVFVQVLQA